MILETEILALLDPVIQVKKKLHSKTYLKKNEPSEYFAGYSEFVSQREAISNHTVKGKKPVKLISLRAPNQSEQELQFTLDTYKQITLPVSFEFISTIGRGLHEGNWSIDYPEEVNKYVTADMTFKKYLEVDIAETPLKMSYDSWVKFVVPSIKINDPMGVVAWKPYREERTVLNENGETVTAGDSLPEPIPYYYICDRVMNPLDWGYALLETNRFSMIEEAGKKVSKGLVYELYDEKNIWIIEQYGKAHEFLFKPTLYFEHNLGHIPVSYLKGMPVTTEEGYIIWQSTFALVSDLLDEALLDGCNLRGAKAACVYPQKVMLGNDCQFMDENHNGCKGTGHILNKDGKDYYKCPECHGTGQTPRTSPINTLFIKAPNSVDQGDGIKPADALAYISPSIETPQFLREEIQQAIINSLSILHLKTTNTVVQGKEDMTATGMVMDEKGKYAFIKQVVDQIFDLMEFGMKCMGGMRYGADFKMPTINRPISYDFNTEGDYLAQIASAQSAGAPPAIISGYVYKYLKAILYDNPRTAQAYDLIIAADRIFTMTRLDINSELSRNLIQPWEVVLHDSALTFIADLVRVTPTFLDDEMETKIAALQTKAKENTPAAIATSRPTLESILGNANA